MLQFHALGGVALTNGGDEVNLGGPRQRRLLAMLLIHRNSVVSGDRLADAVFGGEPTPAASTTLRSYVARVRKAMDCPGSPPLLATQAPGYVLRLPDEAFDVARFEHLLTDAGTRMARHDPAEAASAARAALALWRGGAYAEFADEEWALPEAQRLEELRLVAQERLVDAELACGRTGDLIPTIESLARAHPLRESFRAQLMLAMYRCGRHADALRVFRDYRTVIAEELGLEATPALAELERRVLQHDQGLLLAAPGGLPLRGYRLGERLGTGRDGTVCAAELPGVEREVVVRTFRPQVADDVHFVRSFEARAHRVASLHHPAIVPIHDYWREPGGAYVVMRRMHGGSLADRLERGPITPTAVATLITRVGGALAAAYEHGVTHGRVSAGSVLYDERGDPYLTDFVLGAADPGPSAGDDVHDFAAMVSRCLPSDADPVVPERVTELLGRGMATVGRPSMPEFVSELSTALAGGLPEATNVVTNPYKGLRAFDEADASDFFGRGDLVDEILGRLACDDPRGRLVLVVGGSGTGKSSVVRAGLLPRVRRGDAPGSREWFVTTMLPGSSPFKELAESLRRVAVDESADLTDRLAADGGVDRVIRGLLPADTELLLIIDQFEELFTLAAEPDQRALLDGLIDATSRGDSRLRVVATLRADFYDRPLAFQRFGAAVNGATVTITAMAPAELEAAITEPIQRLGGRVEPALVAELVSAVLNQPAALPSLQFTLFELAERSRGGHLTLAAYRDLGGVDGAIASRAEQLYLALDDVERAAVRHMFERLVVLGPEGEPTRRRVARTELSADSDVDGWAQARLLTLDRHPQTRMPTVELAHEALLRRWPRLAGWIEEDREALVALGQLRDAARSWDALGRDPGALYRGTRLQVAVDVADERPGGVPQLEREFLEASRAERDRVHREEAERAARQARANRRLRIQLAAIAVALVVALIGGFVAVDQRREARQERRVATGRELAAASFASLADDPERSVLLALAAVDTTRSSDGTVLPEAHEALHRAVTASRIVLNVSGIGGSLDWSPDGTIFVTEGPEDSGIVDIRDAATGESVRTFPGHDPDINDVAFSADGSMLATTGDDGAVRVWDPASGHLVSEFQGEPDAFVWGPSFSPDGTLVAASWGQTVRVVDVATGALALEIPSGFAFKTAFSPDGTRIAYIDNGPELSFDSLLRGRRVIVVDAVSGRVVLSVGRGVNIDDVAWSPDGRLLATTHSDGAIDVWDANRGELEFSATGHTARVMNLEWSSDSSRLASSSADGTARVWEVGDQGATQIVSVAAADTGSGPAGLAFSPEGDRLMTGDFAITSVKVWDVSATGGAEWRNIAGAPFAPWAVGFTADGSSILSSTDGGMATVWDLDTGVARRTIGHRNITADMVALAPSPDGELLATISSGPLDVWDLATGEHRFAFTPGRDDFVQTFAWSPDGELLAIAEGDDTTMRVVVVDRSGAEVAVVSDAAGYYITSVFFSPDGSLLATANQPHRGDPDSWSVKIWDWREGTVERAIPTQAALVRFDRTGTRLATTRALESLAEIWDVRTGELATTLSGHTAGITGIAFSHDGSMMASTSDDGTARLWDPETGEQLQVLRSPGTRVGRAVFSPDDSMLATVGEDDGVVRVWALDLDDLIAIANDRLTRGFTDDECRKFLHVERCPAPESPA